MYSLIPINLLQERDGSFLPLMVLVLVIATTAGYPPHPHFFGNPSGIKFIGSRVEGSALKNNAAQLLQSTDYERLHSLWVQKAVTYSSQSCRLLTSV